MALASASKRASSASTAAGKLEENVANCESRAERAERGPECGVGGDKQILKPRAPDLIYL